MTSAISTLSVSQNRSLAPDLADPLSRWPKVLKRVSLEAIETLQRAHAHAGLAEREELENSLFEALERYWFEQLDQGLLCKVHDETFYLKDEVKRGLKALIQGSDCIQRGFFQWLAKYSSKPLDLAQIGRLFERLQYVHRLEQERNVRFPASFWLASSARCGSELTRCDRAIQQIAAFTWRHLQLDETFCARIASQHIEIECASQSDCARRLLEEKLHSAMGLTLGFNNRDIDLIQNYADYHLVLFLDENFFHLFLATCKNVQRELGSIVLRMALHPKTPKTEGEVRAHLHLLELLVENAEDIVDILPILKTQETTEKRIAHLQRRQIDTFKNSEMRIEDSVNRFARLDAKTKPFDVELEALQSDFDKVCTYEACYRKLPPHQLTELARSLRVAPSAGDQTSDEALSLLAIGRLALQQMMKKNPRDFQILTVLKMLRGGALGKKGAIAQVGTGEGKSLCIALLAICLAKKNHSIDIVTSSRYLAKRDQRTFAPLFDRFGISSSQICEDHPPKELFDGQILFGTNTDFEFAALREMLDNAPLRQWRDGMKLCRRDFHVAIVDEVDNLFIDLALNSARIAVKTPNPIEIYLPIYQVVKERKAQVLAFISGDASAWPPLLEALHQQLHRLGLEITGDDGEQKLKMWTQSAYIAQFRKQLDIDYVVKKEAAKQGIPAKESIVIVDRANSGRLQEGSRWHGGLHEFLELKHDLQIRAESHTPASMSHSTYFGCYQKLFGLTGTIGSKEERREIEELYGVTTFDVPPNLPRQFAQLPSKIAHANQLHAALLAEIREMQQKNRPTLLLLPTIEETDHLSQYLTQHAVRHHLLNEQQVVSEDRVIAMAGRPSQVTIATNTAGRGTDITLKPQSLRNGGLHVVFAFYPENDRVENQGFGRAARQGQPGTGRFLLSRGDAAVIKSAGAFGPRFFELDPEIQFEHLRSTRASRVAALSKERKARAIIERVQHEILERFYEHMHRWDQSLDTSSLQSVAIYAGALGLQGGEVTTSETLLMSTPSSSLSAPEDLQRAVQKSLLQLWDAKERLKAHLQHVWAQHFYEKLHDLASHYAVSGFEEGEIRVQLDKLYQQMSPAWTRYFDQPIKSLIEFERAGAATE